MDIPDDVLIHMLGFLEPKDIVHRFLLVCERFRKLANSDPVWEEKMIQIFGLTIADRSPDSDNNQSPEVRDDEVIHVFGSLPGKGLCQAEMTCVRFQQLANFKVLGEQSITDFGLTSENNNSPSSSVSWKEKFIARNSMLQWSQEFHPDEATISPDGKTASLVSTDDDVGFPCTAEFLSKVPLINDNQSPIYFEVQISAKDTRKVDFWCLGVQTIIKQSKHWDLHEHYISIYDDGHIGRFDGPRITSVSDLKVKDGDCIGFVLHQRLDTDGKENESKDENENEEKKEMDYGFIAFYKNGKKITEDIKLTKDESECDFYTDGSGECQDLSFTIQDKPSFLPPLKWTPLPQSENRRQIRIRSKHPLKIPFRRPPGDELSLMA